MSDDLRATPALITTWRQLQPWPRTERCVVCRRGVHNGDDASCERCGLAFHFRGCWVQTVATTAERTAWWHQDEAAIDRLVLYCPACRS